MFTSITFPKKGKGYIYDKPTKPVMPNKNDYRYRKHDFRSFEDTFDEEKFNADMKVYEKELAYYNEHKGKFILPCSKNLVGKTFNFEDGKINLIFGPNASGKSTIIKALAGEALISDGFITIHEPLDFSGVSLASEMTVDDVIKHANRMQKNTCSVVWDGHPVYFDNFEKTLRENYGVFGSMVGSAITDTGEEMVYRIGSNKISAGQNTGYIMNKILNLALKDTSTMNLIGPQYNHYIKGNSAWSNCAKVQLEYFKRYGGIDDVAPVTLIFDEVDKSLDIETVWRLYTEIFPAIVEKKHNQIILVSHNPLVLCDKIYNNPLYNIISVDKDYTKEMKVLLKDAKF